MTLLPAGPPTPTPSPTLPLPAPPAAGPRLPDLPPALRVVRVLLLLEVVVAAVTTVESTAVAVVGLGTPVPALLTAAVTAVLLVVVRRFGRAPERPGTTRAALAVQVVFLAAAALDLAVAVAEQVPPLLVPFLVRWLLPVTVVVLLRGRR